MTDQQATNAYIDKTLDRFRSAVKACGRDIFLVVFLFIITGIFTVFPLVHGYEQEKIIKGNLQGKISKREKIGAIIDQVIIIQEKFKKEKKGIDKYGDNLAYELSERLSAFARAVRALKKGEPTAPDEPMRFPGSSMAEQFAMPSPAPRPIDPKTVLIFDYGMPEEHIKLITSSIQGSPEWKQAGGIVKDVFNSEINRIYKKLNEHVKERHGQLMDNTEAILNSVKPDAEALGLKLPGTGQVIREFEPISRPSDDAVFKSRIGKVTALRIETLKIAVNLNATLEPLNAAYNKIVVFARRLEQSISELQAKQKQVRVEIDTLEQQFADVEAQLSQISSPLKWLPLEIHRFVRFYPTFFALLLFFLSLRFARLSELRIRLYQELRNQGAAEKDINFAVCVPDSMFDIFGGFKQGTWFSKRARLLSPVGILAFLVIATWRIEGSQVYATKLPFMLNLASIALCVISCIIYLRYVLREPSNQSE